MSTPSIKLAPAKRVVSKAFDGNASIMALLVKRATGREFARMVELAEGLLDYDVPQVDVHDVTGIPQKVISSLYRMRGVEVPRAGRWPTGIDRAFATPARHLRMSVFLAAIEKMHPDLKKGEALSGEVLLGALRHTSMVCGSAGEDDIRSRYFIIGIHKLGSGEIYLKTCPHCSVRHVRSNEDIRINGALKVSVSCPNCELIRGRRTGKRTVTTAASMGADIDTPLPDDGMQATKPARVRAKVSEGQGAAVAIV